MRSWLLDTLSAEGHESLFSGLGWPSGTDGEQVRVELLRAATPDVPRDRVRFVTANRRCEAELDLVGREPHQVGSIRLQCAIAASSFGQAGLLVHSAGLELPGRGGVVALAASGGGKSTLSNLATDFIGLSDETVLLRPGSSPHISATPLRSSSEKVPQPHTVPLRALLLLEKSAEPSFTPVAKPEALRALLAQAYKLPVEITPSAQLFKRASELANQVPAFRFTFPKSPTAQELLLRLFDDLDR